MINKLGHSVYRFFYEIGFVCSYFRHLVWVALSEKIIVGELLKQAIHLGSKSFSVVGVTALFIGLAFALQVMTEFVKFGAGSMIGGVVALAVCRELSPLMTGIVLVGRVGSGLTAEISSLKISEQLDAFEALAKPVSQWVCVPRFLAIVLMAPCLTVWSNIVGVLSGYFVVYLSTMVNAAGYFESLQSFLGVWDIIGSLIKSVVFAIVIGTLGCYFGQTVKGGTQGVGIMTRRMVVVSLLTIFILNFMLSVILFS